MNIEKILVIANKIVPNIEYYHTINAYYTMLENIEKNATSNGGLKYQIAQYKVQENQTYFNLINVLENNLLTNLSIEDYKILSNMGGSDLYGSKAIDKINSIRNDVISLANFDKMKEYITLFMNFHVTVYNLTKNLTTLNFTDKEYLIPAGCGEITFSIPALLANKDLAVFTKAVRKYEYFISSLYSIYGVDSEMPKMATIASSNFRLNIFASILFLAFLSEHVLNPILDTSIKIHDITYNFKKEQKNAEIHNYPKEMIERDKVNYESKIEYFKFTTYKNIENSMKPYLKDEPKDNDNRTRIALEWLMDRLNEGYDISVYIDYEKIEDQKEKDKIMETLKIQQESILYLEKQNEALQKLLTNETTKQLSEK